MKRHEIFAIIPKTSVAPPHPDIALRTYGALTAVFAREPAPPIMLPRSRKAMLIAAASRQRRLEELMHLGPILPFQGAVYLSDQSLRSFMDGNAPLLARLCDWLRGKVQFQITVAWNAADVLTRYRDSPEISPLFVGGVISKQDLETGFKLLSERLACEMQCKIASLCAETRALPRAGDIILNMAVLVDHQKIAALDQALCEIDREWTDGLTIKQVGPAPAASFALLCPEAISTTELKAASALLSHPKIGELALARKQALRISPQDAQSIDRAAQILEVSYRLKPSLREVFLCNIKSDGSSAAPGLLAVA